MTYLSPGPIWLSLSSKIPKQLLIIVKCLAYVQTTGYETFLLGEPSFLLHHVGDLPVVDAMA